MRVQVEAGLRIGSRDRRPRPRPHRRWPVMPLP